MNFDRLRFVAERAELGEGREALLAVTIPERPGAFRAFCAALGACVVTEFNYRLSGRDQAEIFVGIATASRHDGDQLAGAAARAGLRDGRSLRQRDGEAPRAAHGGRAHAACWRRARVPLRVPRTSGRADAVSRHARRTLEHQPVSLPQPRRRFRTRARRVRSAGQRAAAPSMRSSRDWATTTPSKKANEAYRRFLGPAS